MRECRRVFSRRSLLWLLVLMAAVVFFHRVDHHNAPGFAAAYRQTVAQLAASPNPSAALSQMEAESRRYMTALLWRSTDDPDLLELYRDQARQVLGDDYEAAAMAYDLSDQAQAAFTARHLNLAAFFEIWEAKHVRHEPLLLIISSRYAEYRLTTVVLTQ